MSNIDLEMSTSKHTEQFSSMCNVLISVPIKSGDTVLERVYYNPKDCLAIYSCTKYMTDKELDWINNKRFELGAKKLPRLAMMKNGMFVIVVNQKERYKIEQEEFKDMVDGVGIPNPKIKNIKYDWSEKEYL